MKNKITKIFLILSIVCGIGTIVSTVFYFIYRSKVNDVEFIGIANKSILEAYNMLQTKKRIGYLTLILLAITVILVVVIVIMFVVKKNKANKVAQTNMLGQMSMQNMPIQEMAAQSQIVEAQAQMPMQEMAAQSQMVEAQAQMPMQEMAAQSQTVEAQAVENVETEQSSQ